MFLASRQGRHGSSSKTVDFESPKDFLGAHNLVVPHPETILRGYPAAAAAAANDLFNFTAAARVASKMIIESKTHVAQQD